MSGADSVQMEQRLDVYEVHGVLKTQVDWNPIDAHLQVG